MESNKKRRSSILKPQKSRNPMSEIEVANDNTATRLLTRRVSFASSNFIKEFAADPEKNTIWNVTYEEIVNKSDSTRSSENAQNTLANQQSQQLIQTTSAPVHNFEEGLITKPQESNINEPSKSIPNVSQPNLPENQVVMKSKCQNKTVTEGCDLEFAQLSTPKNQSEFNKTSLDGSTMDFTGFIDNFKPPLNSTTVKQDQDVKLKDVTLTETSMDITDIQFNNYKIIETKLLNVKNPTEIQDIKSTHKENFLELMDKDCLGRKENFNIGKENMEATQNVPYNLLIGQNIQRETKFNKTAILDESMEFTQKVPELQNYETKSIIQKHQNFPHNLSSIHQNPGIAARQILNKENLEKPINKTNFFNDSMDFTQKPPLNQYNFQSENVRIGQNQQFQPTLLPKSLEVTSSQLILQEGAKTKFFNDSMEFTKSVPLNQCNFQGMQNANMRLNQPIGNNKSSAFQQKDLEITQKNLLNRYNFESENIRMGQNQQFQQTLSQKSCLEIAPSQLVKQEGVKAKLFNDSMNITKNVPLNHCNFDKVQIINMGLNQPTANTQNLALPQNKLGVTQKNLNQYNLESDNDQVENNRQFQQTSSQKCLEIAPNQMVKQESLKTQFFNDSMDITESAPLSKCSFEGVQNLNLGLNQPTSNNQSSALPQKDLEIPQKNILNQYNFESENIRMGQNQQFQQTLSQKCLEIAPNQMIKQESLKTKFFNDSMDITESVPINKCNFEAVQNINLGLKQSTGNTQSLALPQKKLEVIRKNPLNQYNFESENNSMGKNPQFQQTLLQKNSEIVPNPLLQEEGVNTKLFNDTMEFTLKQCNFGGPPKPNDGTQNNALLQKTLEIAQSPIVREENVKTKLFNDSLELTENRPLNQFNFERQELNQPSNGTQNTALLQKTLEIKPSRIVQQEDVKSKLFNNSTELKVKLPLSQDNFEGQRNVRKTLNEPSDKIQNTSFLHKILEIAPSRIVQQEDVKTKPFNDSMKFTAKMPVQQYDFEGQENIGKIPSCGTENPALLQREFEITSSELVQREDVKRKLFNNSMELTENIPLDQKTVEITPMKFVQHKDKKAKIDHGSMEFAHQISLNFDKPNQVLLNPENLHNSCKQDKTVDRTKHSTSEKFITSSRILENQSKLFESMEIPDEIPLNSETYLVQYQRKENTKQIHNWTQTWNDSTQIVQEMSVNRETAIHSMQTLQMSGIKELLQDVSFPEMCGNITEVTQEPSCLDARKVIQKQEESWEKFCNPHLLQERTTSQEHIDRIPSNKPFWNDSYMVKYECERLLDEITPPLHDSLNSIDCSPLHIKKPILPLFKTEIPFRPKLKDFEAYLENTSVEMDEINETLTELKGELLRELTLPRHETVNYEKIDFDALQNCSFEDDMDLASDDSSADDSLLRLNFNSNENDEAALAIREKIQNKNSRCKDYCNIIYVENSKCKFDTLFGSIRLEVDFDVDTGEVNKIEFCDRLSDKSKPGALLAHKVFRDTLSLKHIKAAVGEHYDILTLMDYIYMNMQKIIDFMADLDTFEGHFGLEIDSNFSIKFNIVSLTLKILWRITVDLSDRENISEDSITAVAEVGSLKEYTIKKFLNNCPRGMRFLSAFINNIISHIELLETQRKKK